MTGFLPPFISGTGIGDMMRQVWGQPLLVCESHDYLLYLVAPQALKVAVLLAQTLAVVVISAKPHPQLG